MSTSNTRTTWRQREAEKARLAQMQHIARTEENFPTTMATSGTRTSVLTGMAERVLEAQIQEEVERRVAAYRASMQARERRNMMQGTYFIHRNRSRYQEEDEEEPEEQIVTQDETCPGHGKRGTFTEPDEEGWRLVIKRARRKRELTDEELERKWRADILNEVDEEEQADYNGELSEADQRREFY